MFCTQCGLELAEKVRFCSQCGHPARLAETSPIERARLTRDMANKKIAGVCAGFARYLDTDVILIRVIWLVAAFSCGIGFIAYVVAWIVMPKDTLGTLPAANLYLRENPQ